MIYHLLIDTAAAVHVVRTFNVRSALVGGLETILLTDVRSSVGLLACGTEVETTANHIAGELHEFIDSVIDCFDSVRVVHCKLWIVRRLDRLADYAVADTESIHDKLRASRGPVGDQRVLLGEVSEERWTVVAAVRFCPEIEGLVLNFAIQLRQGTEETL